MKTHWVYILTNHSHCLYIGVTSNLAARLGQHAEGVGSVFAGRYRLNQLVYFETYARARDAIDREKVLKGWRREKKIALIESVNPHWEELTVT